MKPRKKHGSFSLVLILFSMVTVVTGAVRAQAYDYEPQEEEEINRSPPSLEMPTAEPTGAYGDEIEDIAWTDSSEQPDSSDSL